MPCRAQAAAAAAQPATVSWSVSAERGDAGRARHAPTSSLRRALSVGSRRVGMKIDQWVDGAGFERLPPPTDAEPGLQLAILPDQHVAMRAFFLGEFEKICLPSESSKRSPYFLKNLCESRSQRMPMSSACRSSTPPRSFSAPSAKMPWAAPLKNRNVGRASSVGRGDQFGVALLERPEVVLLVLGQPLEHFAAARIAREVFQRLAEDEKHHLGTLEQRYAELIATDPTLEARPTLPVLQGRCPGHPCGRRRKAARRASTTCRRCSSASAASATPTSSSRYINGNRFEDSEGRISRFRGGRTHASRHAHQGVSRTPGQARPPSRAQAFESGAVHPLIDLHTHSTASDGKCRR